MPALSNRFGLHGLLGVLLLGGRLLAAPLITTQPVDATTNVGGAAAFRVTATGAAPVTFQWQREGQVLPNATSATLMIPHAVATDAGRYAVQIRDAQGSVTSATAALIVQAAPARPIVDPSFHGDPSLPGSPTAFLPLADGRVVLATSEGVKGDSSALADRTHVKLVRLLPDGRIDPTFRIGVPTIDEFEPQSDIYPPKIGSLVIQPDGRLLVAGHFVAFNGVACAGVVRLMASGEVDPTFAAPTLYNSQLERSYQANVALQPDGKILVFGYGMSGLKRLLPGGQVDATFVPDSAASFANVAVVGPTGRIFIGTGLSVQPRGDGLIIALREDGSRDPTFARYDCDAVWRLCALNDGGVLASTLDSESILPGETGKVRFPVTTFRLRADGTADPRFALRPVPMTAAAADGTVLIDSTLVAPDVTETSLNLGLGYLPAVGFAANTTAFLAFIDGKGGLWYAGAFSFYNGVPTRAVVHLNLVTSENIPPPTVLGLTADATSVRYGDTITLRAAATGSGPLTYVWSSLAFNLVMATTTEPVYAFPATENGVGNGGGFSVQVVNSAGASALSQPVTVGVQPGELKLVNQPHRISLMSGRSASFSLQLSPNSATHGTAVWRRNGSVLKEGDTGLSLDFSQVGIGVVQPTQAGTYIATLTDSLGQTVTSEPITVVVDDTSRFTNLSVRAQVGTGEQAAFLGFVIPPGPRREVIIRGIGPSLAAFGVSGALAEARLDLFDSAGRAVRRSKTWGTSLADSSAADFAKVGAFALAPGSHDAAIGLGLAPGSYTARLSGVNGATGVGLIELYENDNLSDRLSNVSARVVVPKEVPTIVGFAIRGPIAKDVLVRAVGPGLTAFGVAGALANPALELASASRIVATNDDWGTPPLGTEIADATTRLGAFALAAGSKDAALLSAVPPENYTARVTSATGESGVVLVEVYEAPAKRTVTLAEVRQTP